MLNKLMKLKNKKGFTLVELIVVIAIIAILTAIIVPLVGRYSAQATYTTLQDAAQTVSNNTNTVISDVTMMGSVYGPGYITGTKSNSTGSNSFTVTVYSGTTEIGKSTTGTAATAASPHTQIGEDLAAKLWTSLNNALPANCIFYVKVAKNTVEGVCYSTAEKELSKLPTADTAKVTKINEFTDAYQYNTNPIGVSGCYKNAAAAETSAPAPTPAT